MRRSALIIFLLSIIFISPIIKADSPPSVIDVEGTIYNSYGNLIDRSVNVSLENLNNSMKVAGETSKDMPYHFKISLGGNVGDTATLVVWNREHSNTTNITLGIGSDGRTITSASLNMTIINNYPPDFLSPKDLPEATENSNYEYSLDVEDYNINDTVTLTLAQSPEAMSLNGTTLLWTPTQADVDHGPYTIIVNASDGKSSSEQEFTLNVLNVNEAPKITSAPSWSAKEDSKYTYQVTASDEDHDNLTYSIIEGPAGANMNSSTGLLAWTPTADNIGDNIISVNVTDGNLSEEQDWIVYVGPKDNNDPVISSTPATTAYANYEYTYQVSATDADNDKMAYSLVSQANNAYIEESGKLHWTPTSDDIINSPILFVILVIDEKGGSDTQTFYVNITNSAPPSPISKGSSSSLSQKTSTIIAASQDSETNESARIIAGNAIYENIDTLMILYDINDTTINFATVEAGKNSNLLFQIYDAKPKEIPPIQAFVYAYFKLASQDNSSRIDNATIEFSLPKHFLDENNIATDDIALLGYNGSWHALKTSHEKSGNGNEYFKSTTRFLDYFAIISRRNPPIPETTYKPTPAYSSEGLLNISGKIYSQNMIIQVDRMTEYSIIDENTKQEYRGFTGLVDSKNPGSYSNMIKASKGDMLNFKIYYKNKLMHEESVAVSDENKMIFNMYTSIPSEKSAHIYIALIACLALMISSAIAYKRYKRVH